MTDLPIQSESKAAQTRVIQAAYTAAMMPQELDSFHESAADFVDSALNVRDDTIAIEQIETAISGLSQHVEHAADLLVKRLPYAQGEKAARRYISEDPRPSALISKDGRIEFQNDCTNSFGFEIDKTLSNYATDSKETRRLETFLEVKDGTAITVRLGYHATRFVLSPVLAEAGVLKYRLTALRPLYEKHIGDQVTRDFSLTPSEQLILEGLIQGKKLTVISEQRCRSIETIRNQLKSVLSKTGMKSQADLVSLYNMYAHQTSWAESTSDFEPETASNILRRKSFFLEDGRTISVTFAGPRSGRPVLYLNTILTGNEVPDALMRDLLKRKIQLIMPWRSGWETSSPYADLKSMSPITYLNKTVQDLLYLMDELGLERLPCLAANSGLIPACALATKAPKRISGIFSVSPSLPLLNIRSLSLRPRQQRIYLAFARYAPSVVRAYCRFATAKLDAGFDEEHGENFFKDQPRDLTTSRDPEGKRHLRRALAAVREQGVDAMAMDMMLEAAPWQNCIADLSCPLHFTIGEDDRSFAQNELDDFFLKFPDVRLETIKDAGHLALLQKGGVIIDRLCEFMESLH